MSVPFPIRPVTADDYPEMYAVFEQACNAHWPTEAARRHDGIVFEPDRSLAAIDSDRIVGTTGAFTFQMSVPGGITAVAGVTGVNVLPTHRRRGVLSSLMERQLADIAERGEALAALHASESAIYGRFGYGVATENSNFTIRRGEGRLLAPYGAAGPGSSVDGLHLRLAAPRDVQADLAKVYDTVLPTRPGIPSRNDRWWESVLADPEFARHGYCPLRCLLAESDSGPRGYALYSARPGAGDDAVPDGKLRIREFLTADPVAGSAMWADLLTRDLVSEVRVPLRPVDDPLLSMLADRRRARPYLSDGMWVRVVRLPDALRQRRYASEVDVVIEVTDDLLAQNEGRWRLEAGGPADPAPPRCQRTSAATDIALPVRALGAIYLGGTRLGSLAGAGQVTELRRGALAELSTAMSWDPAPWCPVQF